MKSPTGFCHLAGIRTALYSYLFARQNGGDFILRIEDTDTKRTVEGAEDYIGQALNWCDIIPTESPWVSKFKYRPYRQSERDYKPYAQQLVDNGLVYEQDGAIRFKIPETYDGSDTISVRDAIRGVLEFKLSELDDKVILKSDGTPTYHLASVVDDYLMEITHVFRGDEWLPSFPFHILLYSALKLTAPIFIHLPVILNPDGKGKLSKRNAATKGYEIFPLACDTEDEKGNPVHFTGYKDLNYEPIAVVNMIALLGHTFPKDVMTMDEMIESFSLQNIHHNPAKFDINKLNFLNKEHLKNVDNLKLWGSAHRLNNGFNVYNKAQAWMIIENIKPKVNVWSEMHDFLYPYFYHEKTKDVTINTVVALQQIMLKLIKTDYNEDLVREVMSEIPIDKKELREIVCSGKSGSELAFVISMIGQNELNDRLNKY